MANLRGTLQPLRQSVTDSFAPNQGFERSEEFTGHSYDAMQALAADYQAAGIACSVTFRKGISGMSTRDATQQYTIDTWQILGNEEHRDGFSHPTLLALLSDDSVGLLRQHLENQDKPSELDAPLAAAGFSAANIAIIKRFYSLNQRGSSEYRRGQYVLVHETNAPNRWNSNIADIGVDHIYTQAQLMTEVQDGSLWIFPLPGRLVYKLGQIPPPAARANYQWGWLKGASTETTAANNRISIRTEYVLEQWSTDYYQIF